MIKVTTKIAQLWKESLVKDYFQLSVGEWKSQRRYYTLQQDSEPQEVESLIKIRFLESGSTELIKLGNLHHLDNQQVLLCGTEVTWESNYTGKIRKPSKGMTVFGVLDNILYRDRGFATAKPVTASFEFSNPQTMSLRTEYNGSVFEEEIKLIGKKYRTRQTIISRAGEEQMIGQYLETRIN